MNAVDNFQTAQHALSLRGVTKRFAGRAVVDDVSLTVDRGEILGVLGANGSGKSTLIRLVSTLLLPDAGTLSVFGLDVVKQELNVKRLINRVSVDAAFFKRLTPMENLLYAGRLYGLGQHATRERGYAVLESLGISQKVANQPMEHMSRGMQQKVAISRALLTAPVLLLLDEPTTGLDLRREHDATVVLTTHDMDEADRLCDRVAVIDRGRIIALDTPAALKHGRSLEDVFMQLTNEEEDAA